jgi:hypothetical protein
MMTNIAGALVSLALVAGIGVWGYKLMVRDVSGIPIVRAAEGDMRVRPEDPGGQLARHQGLAVNAIAAHGEAAGPVDQVVLAPPAVALAAEDQPVIAPAATTPADFIARAATAPVVRGTPVVQPPEEGALPAPEQDEIDAVVALLMAETTAGADLEDNTASGAKTITVPPSDMTETVAPVVTLVGLQQSMRPRMRPAGGPALVQPASFTPPAATREVDPKAIPSGTRLVQLGAFDSPDVARAEWARMQARFGSILNSKSRVIEEAQSGGRTFYRLRAMGFVDLSDTRRFCSAVKAEGVDCIPVQVK